MPVVIGAAVAVFSADARGSRHNGPTIPVSSPRTAKSRTMSRKSKSFLPRLRRWRRGARWARRKLASAPRAARIVGVVAILLAVVALTNLVYHVIHKPTELFAFVGNRLDKEPAETWRQYGPLFRAYSTNTITPELLAALAQVESTGNPVARTYWRWQLSLNPLAVYQPASSAVGLYQMTDAAYAEAVRSCIRGNGCRLRVHQPLYPHDPQPFHRADVRVSGPQCRGGSRPRTGRDGKPAAETGSRCLHPSLRRRSRHSIRTP